MFCFASCECSDVCEVNHATHTDQQTAAALPEHSFIHVIDSKVGTHLLAPHIHTPVTTHDKFYTIFIAMVIFCHPNNQTPRFDSFKFMLLWKSSVLISMEQTCQKYNMKRNQWKKSSDQYQRMTLTRLRKKHRLTMWVKKSKDHNSLDSGGHLSVVPAVHVKDGIEDLGCPPWPWVLRLPHEGTQAEVWS